MEKKRPVGILVIGIVDIIIGLIGLPFLGYGIWSFFEGLLTIFGPYGFMYLIGGITFILGGILGIVLIMSGIWKIKLKERGRKLNLYLSPLFAIATFFGVCFIIGSTTLTIMLPILISLGLLAAHIFYLTRPKIKERFK